MVSFPNTREISPKFSCPIFPFTMAMDGMGIPPNCNVRFRSSAFMLCTAIRSFVSSIGSFKENLTPYFFAISSFSLSAVLAFSPAKLYFFSFFSPFFSVFSPLCFSPALSISSASIFANFSVVLMSFLISPPNEEKRPSLTSPFNVSSKLSRNSLIFSSTEGFVCCIFVTNVRMLFSSPAISAKASAVISSRIIS